MFVPSRAGRVVAALALVPLAAWTTERVAQRAASATASAASALPDSTFLRGYRWRNIGPDRGGRSIAASGVKGRPREAYFGATGGGLWKTTDGGTTWTPVTDGKITTASVGAVAVSETNPDVVYIGMGESCIRGNILVGDGVYKSTDAGKTWTHVGFRDSDAISKIRIHPTNPNVVFVASFGKYGSPSEERGVFKSSDGGKSWKRVLFRDANTGAVDIAIDQRNPNVMYAAMWEAFRKEYQMSSGGPGTGLFKSTDGGETWVEITRNNGLPSGVNGRIGVAVSPANPNRVWALVENANGGLFRSEDGGATWALINSNRNIRQRAFYYTHVIADPKNADLVYLLNVSAYRSTDGGKTLSPLGTAGGDEGTHGDYHDLWVDPENSDHMVVANDGGGAVTTTSARAWTPQDFPTAQFYHIVATKHAPVHFCGSQQDSNEQCVPYTPPGAGGGGFGRGGPPAIYSPGGSENGWIAPDPLNVDVFYSGTNFNGGGLLTRLDRRTGQTREVSPYPRMFQGEESAVLKERWQWTYPIVFSPVNPRVLYVSSQHVWRTANGGDSWERISPDLTRHDPKTLGPSGGPITRDMNMPEVYATVFALGPSKRTERVLWAGSDDGLVHVTRDGGKTWQNVTPRDMPDFGRVSLIDASAFDSATAYVAVKRPLLGDRAPYIFRTHDFGKTWTKIVNGIGERDFVHAVREDPIRKGMLYAGTDHGVYLSYDDGATWASLSLNLADAPVVSIAVEPNVLGISVHGRSFWVLDDIGPLRQYGATMAANNDPVLFAPPAAVRATGPVAFKYWLKQPAQRVTLEVLDAGGRVVREFVPDTARSAAPNAGPNLASDSMRTAMRGNAPAVAGAPNTPNPPSTPAPTGPDTAGAAGGGPRRGAAPSQAPAKTAGLNTVTWDLRTASATTFPGMILWGASTNGPTVPPGAYRVRLTVDGKSVTQPLTVTRNPRFTDVTDADLRAQFALATRIRNKVSEANQAVVDIRRIKTDVADRLKQSTDPTLKARGDALVTAISAVEEEIYQVRNQSGQDPLNFPIKVNNRLASLLGVVSNSEARPIANADPIFQDLVAELKVQTDRLQRVLGTELPAFNAEARRLGLTPVATPRTVVQ